EGGGGGGGGGGEHQEKGGDKRLGGDGIELAAERRRLAPLGGEVAVKHVGHARHDEDEQRHPAQPEAALQDVLPVETRNHRRHRDDAGIGQEVWHRERPRRQGSRRDRVHGTKEYPSGVGV